MILGQLVFSSLDFAYGQRHCLHNPGKYLQYQDSASGTQLYIKEHSVNHRSRLGVSVRLYEVCCCTESHRPSLTLHARAEDVSPCQSPMRQIVICEYGLCKLNCIDWLIHTTMFYFENYFQTETISVPVHVSIAMSANITSSVRGHFD